MRLPHWLGAGTLPSLQWPSRAQQHSTSDPQQQQQHQQAEQQQHAAASNNSQTDLTASLKSLQRKLQDGLAQTAHDLEGRFQAGRLRLLLPRSHKAAADGGPAAPDKQQPEHPQPAAAAGAQAADASAAADQHAVCVYTSGYEEATANMAASSHVQQPAGVQEQQRQQQQQQPLPDHLQQQQQSAWDEGAWTFATVGPLPGPPTQLQRAVEVSSKLATPERALRILQVTLTAIVGISSIVLASFRVVTRAVDSGPGATAGERVDCYRAPLGPASYGFDINALITLLVTCTPICLALLIPGLARKVAWLAYTAVHTPRTLPIHTLSPQPPQPSAPAAASHSNLTPGKPPRPTALSPAQTAAGTVPVPDWVLRWLLPSGRSDSWHVALAATWAVIFALTCFGTYRYQCSTVRVLLALTFLVCGAHAGSAVLGWLVRRRAQGFMKPASGGAGAAAGRVGPGDVELAAQRGKDTAAAAATAAGEDACVVDFEEPCGVQPQVVQLGKTKSQ